MYLIVNYEKFWKHPNIFYKFNNAFMVYELLEEDPNNIIEYYDENYNREIVWKKEFENISSDILSGYNDRKFRGITWVN